MLSLNLNLKKKKSSKLWPFVQSELPICEAVQCGLPGNPENGNALFTAVSFKSVVSYECNYGYMIVGNASRQAPILSGSLALHMSSNVT